MNIFHLVGHSQEISSRCLILYPQIPNCVLFLVQLAAIIAETNQPTEGLLIQGYDETDIYWRGNTTEVNKRQIYVLGA